MRIARAVSRGDTSTRAGPAMSTSRVRFTTRATPAIGAGCRAESTSACPLAETCTSGSSLGNPRSAALLQRSEIGFHHHFYELLEIHLRSPTQNLACLAG